MEALVDEAAESRQVVGYAFYHSQDTDSARESGWLCIRYGAVDEESFSSVDVGDLILDALLRADLDAEWNGDPGTVVEVNNLTWRRHRPRPALGDD